MSDLTLLAVTRMRSGFCIAGLAPNGRWVRPVKDRGALLLPEITCRAGEHMAVFDVVRFPVLRPRPQPPHIEDCVSDFIRARPIRVGHLTPKERAALLAARAAPDPAVVLEDCSRSLCLVRATRLEAFFYVDRHTGRYEARLAVDGGRPIPVTDLRWRALGRRLLGRQGGERRLAPQQVAELLGGAQVYVAYGLTRAFRGRFWALVVGVHPVPDFDVTVDCRRP